ncbi:Thiol:disulfide interchange protein TlpA [Roseovarius litorisediminis]|uniref:Thiol:disulfide interchange protein TlpA n=1 Tax=Roseovarius litorisediminis TaxID=1312363 RepID=A0A1Y5RS60_9RHOB|nr:TlpA disulfide reductase family protein [Roseovarius litorisediminis]SLN21280.1 Thiol:disulfide interchange protein TlpA [Roseovarius litorisediminis]
MKIFRLIVLYMAVALGANMGFADTTALEALRDGDMKKLNFHTQPKAVSDARFEREDGSQGTLADFRGKYTVLNFWATWCAPCRAEMPMLSDLQTRMGGENFQVITIATGRNPAPAMKKFFDEIGVSNLPLHRDPQSALAREMGVFGLPITVLLDKNGMEIGRLLGDAEWNSDSAQSIIQALIDGADAT